MRALLILLFFAATAMGADKHPGELLANMTNRSWPGESYPALPSLSPTVADGAYDEMARSPAIRQAIADLNPHNYNVTWSAAERVLEREHAVWCLQACLCHPRADVQINALCALGRLKDQKAVPFLLIYAEYMAVSVGGSENATLHGFIHTELAKTLSVLTGVVVQIPGQDPDGLLKAVREWRRWQVEHPTDKV